MPYIIEDDGIRTRSYGFIAANAHVIAARYDGALPFELYVLIDCVIRYRKACTGFPMSVNRTRMFSLAVCTGFFSHSFLATGERVLLPNYTGHMNQQCAHGITGALFRKRAYNTLAYPMSTPCRLFRI